MDMTQRFAKAQLRLMKYAAFIGVIGGIATFVGPNHHGMIKAMIGVVVGCMLLGNKLPAALKELWDTNSELTDELFKD